MIEVHTKYVKDCIRMNDAYFNTHTATKIFDEQSKEVMYKIDSAILLRDGRIKTQFGIGTILNLSTGCKTILNIMNNRNLIFTVDECGPNALSIIFSMDNITIVNTIPQRFSIPDDQNIIFNDEAKVKGRNGYDKWWSAEYERRNAE